MVGWRQLNDQLKTLNLKDLISSNLQVFPGLFPGFEFAADVISPTMTPQIQVKIFF